MNGDRPTVNGALISNGTLQSATDSSSDQTPIKHALPAQNSARSPLPSSSQNTTNATNGHVASGQPPGVDGTRPSATDMAKDAPPEILELISHDSYLPMAALISRASQSCWNGLSALVEQLAAVTVPDLGPEHAKLMSNGLPNNQSRANLDKKDRIFDFANSQKADFIKLLVLLQWSKNVDEVSKTISLNYWLMLRRQAYWEAIRSLALLKRESSAFQIPNPDLKTAAEVLSTGNMGSFPKLGYMVEKDLSNNQILRVLKSLNQALSVKLALSDNIAPPLRTYRIHDGRATFIIPHEFELDISTLDHSLESPFRMVDFRFAFQPAPYIPDRLHSDIEQLANTNIDQRGLTGCFEFLHELTLSYKLAELHKQAIELSRNQWAGNLRVQLLRRNLVIQYWSERSVRKSWIEIGISSGRVRSIGVAGLPCSFLEIKSMRHGKKVETLQLDLHQSILNVEDILRQIIAQHITETLASIYDKLVLSPLFANDELHVEQSLSYNDPQECSLTMQTARTSQLELKMDSVTGLVMLSPVSERTERLQFEVNRVQAVADEVVSKLLNYRCSVVENMVLAGIAGTVWEPLRSFKFSQTEIKSLFGRPVVRMNMFRQAQWGLDYSLAITHSQDADYWSLLQKMPAPATNSPVQYRALYSQRIPGKDEMSPAYFERLSNYSIGLIALQRNADFLEEKKEKFDLAPFPQFERSYELPELGFNLEMGGSGSSRKSQLAGSSSGLRGGQASTDANETKTDERQPVRLRYDGIEQASGKVMMVAQYYSQTSSAVLHLLDKSGVDASVALDAEVRKVTMHVETRLTETAIPGVVAKVSDLDKVVSTVGQIHTLTGFKLKTLTNSKISTIYHGDSPSELGVDITFTSGSLEPQLHFFPAETNPHQILSRIYAKRFCANREAFALTMRNFLTNLVLTLPLLTYLRQLQSKHGLQNRTDQQAKPQEDDLVRVHVIARTEVHFGVQYFSRGKQALKEAQSDSASDMLARFEILPRAQPHNKPMWVVRPAVEEFQSDSRASYASPELASKVKQEIFSNKADEAGKWITLDKGASCTTDQPESLLQAIHEVMCNWAKQVDAPKGKTSNNSEQIKVKGTQGAANTNSTQLPSGTGNKPPGPVKGPPGRLQGLSNANPHGTNMKGQRPPANAPGSRQPNTKSSVKNPPQEFITID